MKQDVYERITAKIVADLEQGVRPWLKPWNAEHAAGRILLPLRSNGIPYRGINIVMLWMEAMEKGFSAPIWMTFKQALELGAHVRKGEKGSLVVYADTITRNERDENGEESEAVIRRGLVRPEDARKAKAAAKAGTDADAGAPAEIPGLSAALVTDLTAHRSATISAVLCEKPDIALAAVVHAMWLNIRDRAAFAPSCLQISIKSIQHDGFLASPGSCKGIEALNLVLERWGERMPGDPADLWQWCLAQPRETLLDLLAVSAACAVDSVLRKGERKGSERIRHADALARSLSISMSDWCTPTAEGYFSRIGKPQIVDAYKAAKGTEPAPAWLKLKKTELATHVAKAIAGTGWLPEVLRPADSASEEQREAASSSPAVSSQGRGRISSSPSFARHGTRTGSRTPSTCTPPVRRT